MFHHRLLAMLTMPPCLRQDFDFRLVRPVLLQMMVTGQGMVGMMRRKNWLPMLPLYMKNGENIPSSMEPFPNNASDYRQWKNTLILLFGRVDTSGEEAMAQWIAPAFHVGAVKASDCLESSGLFPRLDRWLAGELIKSIKGLPELSFKVRAYVEGCTQNLEEEPS